MEFLAGGGSLQDITSGYVPKRHCIILVLTSQLTWKYIDYYSFTLFKKAQNVSIFSRTDQKGQYQGIPAWRGVQKHPDSPTAPNFLQLSHFRALPINTPLFHTSTGSLAHSPLGSVRLSPLIMSFDSTSPLNTDPNARVFSSSCFDFLLIELVPMAERMAKELATEGKETEDEEVRETTFFRLESLGYRVGQGLAER